MSRLIAVSPTPRSRRIGTTRRLRIWRSTNDEMLASVRTATTYHAYAGEAWSALGFTRDHPLHGHHEPPGRLGIPAQPTADGQLLRGKRLEPRESEVERIVLL